MSDFSVRLQRVDAIVPMANADMLELALVGGWQVVVPRDTFMVGSRAIYFPVDSLIPDWLVASAGLRYLQGNRVRTVKLRGAISQGLLLSVSDLNSPQIEDAVYSAVYEDANADLTELLGVTKYEPPVSASWDMLDQPVIAHYDIESAQNYLDVVKALMNVPVIITEKVEGTHFAVTRFYDGREVISQRNFAIKPDALTHPHAVAWEKSGLRKRMERMWEDLVEVEPDVHSLTWRGEMIGAGIQRNIYQSPTALLFFEIEINSNPVNAVYFDVLAHAYSVPTVPYVSMYQTLEANLKNAGGLTQLATGKSRLGATLREGIVIRPCEEFDIEGFGRAILKVRSPEYLAQNKL